MEKIMLNVGERLVTMQLLPHESKYSVLRIVRILKNKLGVTSDEYKEFEVKEQGGKISWNKKGNEEKEIEFTTTEADIVRESLRDLNEKKKLEERHVSLYEKFVRPEEK